jgi:uncharacterized membrane protein
MESTNEIIQQLRAKLDLLRRQQNAFGVEFEKFEARVQAIEKQIAARVSQQKEVIQPKVEPPKIVEEKPVAEKIEVPKAVAQQEPKPELKPRIPADRTNVIRPAIQKEKVHVKTDNSASSFERFIGENLASKIGIVIIIIGVGIGVKYAIDNNLMGPTMRILLGYAFGAALVGIAILLRKKYDNFSAVLFGGGMAIAYFVTFLAYDFYAIFSKTGAFGTMLGFTAITTLTAVKFNKQIVAIIGLVGAYGVPFMLSDGTGSIWSMFAYMSLLNLGVLAITFFKGWKALQAVAFGSTWFIFGVLLLRNYLTNGPEEVFLVYVCVFYAIFYAATIAYKLRHRENFDAEHIALLLTNTVLAYAIGIVLIESVYDSSLASGLFTMGFAGSHVICAIVAKTRKQTDIRLFYFSFGLALIFATITIPVVLDGQWITLMWALEAALLYWIGRSKNTGFYEKISFIPLGLALISILASWTGMDGYAVESVTPVFNNYFLTGMLFSGVLFFMAYIKHQTDSTSDLEKTGGFFSGLGSLLMYCFIGVMYFTCYFEIETYWSLKQGTESAILDWSIYQIDADINNFKVLWILIYTMLKNPNLGTALGIVSSALLLIFLTIGLWFISMLRDATLYPDARLLEGSEGMYVTIRYYGLIALGSMLIINYYSLKKLFDSKQLNLALEIILHVSFIWFMSSEIVHWKHLNGGDDYYRTGLSILWGLYSVGLIVFGIWKRKPHLRIIAMIIFGLTLLKLFLYDIANASSGAKTIAFISLGVLLLIISFLYTKYRHLIAGDEEQPEEIEN